MTIRTIEGSEVRRGSCSISQVEVKEVIESPGGFLVSAYQANGWEFVCDACDAFSTNLTEDEARAEMDEHVCPDVPPCER